MQFRVILSLFVGLSCVLPLAQPLAQAANTLPEIKTDAKADAVLTDMAQAFKRGDRKRLSALLPQAKGHVLEPWAAYWELRARLDEASNQEVRNFFTRYPATYQEDRLRNDWLLELGRRRDWAGVAREYPRFRMDDDLVWGLLTSHGKTAANDSVSRLHASILMAGRHAEAA